MVIQAERLLHLDSNVTGSLLPSILKIFRQWRLTAAQQMILLGLGSEETLCSWKRQPDKAKLTRDQLERTSYILGIFKSLQVLLPEQTQADRWLATPNDNSLFKGTKPLDHMLAGQVSDLAAVRNFLDAERGGC